MKIYWLSLFAGLVALLSFQNCQKAPYQDEINLSTNANVVSSGNKINLSEQRVSEIDFISTDAQTVFKNGHTFSILANQTTQVELVTGKISYSSDTTNEVKFYCLTEDLKNELLNIVKSSSVCKGSFIPATGQVCNQALRLPYANIVTTNEKFELGSATDGCGSNAVDLCEQQASLLKGFAANLKAKLTTLTCP